MAKHAGVLWSSTTTAVDYFSSTYYEVENGITAPTVAASSSGCVKNIDRANWLSKSNSARSCRPPAPGELRFCPVLDCLDTTYDDVGE